MAKTNADIQEDQAIEKARVDLQGNVEMTTEEELARDTGAELDQEVAEKADEVVDKNTAVEEEVSDTESVEVEEKQDEEIFEEDTTEDTESVETEEVEKEVEEKDEVVGEAEIKSNEGQEAEKSDIDIRMTKLEDMVSKIAEAIAKSEDTEDATDEVVEAEVEVEKDDAEEAEVTEDVAEDVQEAVVEEVVEESDVESEKADTQETIQKFELEKAEIVGKLAKVEAEYANLQKAHTELKESYEAILNEKRPSKVVTPFAIAKGVEIFDKPTEELDKINKRLEEIDKIKTENPGLFKASMELQQEAYQLVKDRKNIRDFQLA